ncbi:peptidoglycan editing factor PgeF [Nocardioides euryhalodurans]|uniref:Purine nucleoside phosphorylase n=1 Tax=Nocardioides euryhalodurans TaxID=2518370 RepID=A0A4P7GGL5_9ACTN|nr:peptidoglycan editing factor PgeF [Nocardioides euryhalodurans]QBR90854.1 peptidoglycan editing factor PgeF [Nocardioides euryhalodurans]
MTLLLRDRLEGDLVIEVAFTGSTLDLGDRADAEVRSRALAAVSAATGAEPVVMRQVHGADVEVVEDAAAAPTCDALVTTRPGLALLARAADCVPVLLADPAAGVVAAVHSGRPGLAAGVVPATLRRMRRLGAEQVVAWVGPHVCGACYEVPEALRDEVAALVPEARSTTSWGTPALDLGAGVRAQLAAAGVATVHEVRVCTREDADWPSYRRDGDAATRFAGVVWMSPR